MIATLALNRWNVKRLVGLYGQNPSTLTSYFDDHLLEITPTTIAA
jgi:hypothetical protein